MKRADFRYLEALRVRWAEVDMQKIVFNGHYLLYVDTAVAGYWRALAMPYHATMEKLEGDLFVRKATLEYEASARYDDRLEVGIRTARIGKSSIGIAAAVFRGEQLLVHGELVYVFADPHTQTSQPVPQALREVMLGYEAGEPVFGVKVGAWAALGADAQAIRMAVFAEEQLIPAGLVVDADDAGAVHAVAYNRFGAALASGRLLRATHGVAQIGRMATLAPVRGGGLGAAVLAALQQAAAARGDRAVQLHAQATAVSFYRPLGYAPVGAPFEAAGLPHQTMRRAL